MQQECGGGGLHDALPRSCDSPYIGVVEIAEGEVLLRVEDDDDGRRIVGEVLTGDEVGACEEIVDQEVPFDLEIDKVHHPRIFVLPSINGKTNFHRYVQKIVEELFLFYMDKSLSASYGNVEDARWLRDATFFKSFDILKDRIEFLVRASLKGDFAAAASLKKEFPFPNLDPENDYCLQLLEAARRADDIGEVLAYSQATSGFQYFFRSLRVLVDNRFRGAFVGDIDPAVVRILDVIFSDDGEDHSVVTEQITGMRVQVTNLVFKLMEQVAAFI